MREMKETEAKKHLKKAAFECWVWQHDNMNSFTSQLFDLIAKADVANRQKLMFVFPAEVWAYKRWCEAEDQGEEFFRQWVGEKYE